MSKLMDEYVSRDGVLLTKRQKEEQLRAALLDPAIPALERNLLLLLLVKLMSSSGPDVVPSAE